MMTNREHIDWWNDLSWKEQLSLVCKYLSDARMPSSVSGDEIKMLYKLSVRK